MYGVKAKGLVCKVRDRRGSKVATRKIDIFNITQKRQNTGTVSIHLLMSRAQILLHKYY